MVTDSDDSAPEATDDSSNRRSGRVSAQKAASASSRSNRGTSSQLAMAFMSVQFLLPAKPSCKMQSPRFTQSFLPRERLVQLALVEELFFRIKRTAEDDPDLLSVCSIHAEDPQPARRSAQVEIPRLDRKP